LNLRKRIEDDAHRPTRLVTTAAGYGFGDGEPVRFFSANAD
jgi:hypothetical protein